MVMSNYTTESYTSTLLIPEKIAWLPYACLVVTVVTWLGYDFYRFHRNHMKKYARIEEHAVVLKATASRQRISMVSGIGFRFRRGKPIIGDVWNTSPSSSDMSVYCAPRRNALVSYSREVTPSDEGGEYSETDLFASSRYGSCEDLVQNEAHNTSHKGWEIGGEYAKAGNCGNTEENTDKDHDDSQSRNTEDRLLVIPSAEHMFPSATITIDSYQPTGTKTGSAGGGVDDGGGGGRRNPTRRDASTQTAFNDFMINITPDQNATDKYPGHVYIYPLQTPYSASSSPRPPRNAEGTGSHSPQCHSAGTPDRASPWFGNISSRLSFDGRPMDVPKSSTLPKYTGGKSEKKYQSPLNLDLPYSPTSEIVAIKHGFALEGLEVPYFPGSGGRSLPSSGSDIFKPSSSRGPGLSLHKPLNPSPAVSARVVTPRATMPKYSVAHMEEHQTSMRQSHHHRHRRRESVVAKTPENPPSKTVSLSRKHSKKLPSRLQRDTLSSRNKDNDSHKESVGMKLIKDSSLEDPDSAPIPSHLYHQDEEGFFSSLSSSQAKRMFNRDGDDYGNKGILFFSRLAGIGRHHEAGMGGGRMTFKSGGFES